MGAQMPVEDTLPIPGHRADCECDACFEEICEMRKALYIAKSGGMPAKNFYAGFALGWAAGRRYGETKK